MPVEENWRERTESFLVRIPLWVFVPIAAALVLLSTGLWRGDQGNPRNEEDDALSRLSTFDNPFVEEPVDRGDRKAERRLVRGPFGDVLSAILTSDSTDLIQVGTAAEEELLAAWSSLATVDDGPPRVALYRDGEGSETTRSYRVALGPGRVVGTIYLKKSDNRWRIVEARSH